MSALFVQPIPFVRVGGDAGVAGTSVANLTNDEPGMVWRSTGATINIGGAALILDLGAGASYDTVALVGSNLRTTDTVRVRTGTTSTGVGAGDSTTMVAWTGIKPPFATATTIIKLNSVRTERYLRVDIIAYTPTHPDGFVQVQRVVIGKAVTTLGFEFGFEQGFNDRSIIADGAGFRSVDEYDVIPTAKFATSMITDASWRADWFPLLQWAGNRRAILFVPDDTTPNYWQTDAIFGPITSRASGKNATYNSWTLEATITALSQ